MYIRCIYGIFGMAILKYTRINTVLANPAYKCVVLANLTYVTYFK